MKKLVVLFLLCFIYEHFGIIANETPVPDKIYYWFYVRLGKSVEKHTKAKKLQVKKIGRDLESGTLHQFIQRHSEGLRTGLIYIGPFTDKDKALDAKNYYKLSKTRKKNPVDTTISDSEDSALYYYLTRPLLGRWMQPVSFQRIPSRIASGSLNDFLSMLDEGLTFQIFAIGPFEDYSIAEKSKFTFRKNGEPGLANSPDTTQQVSIEDMVKNWKSLKFELVKKPSKKDDDKVIYTLRINFPKNYFVEDAFQTITIRPKYSNPQLTSNTGITFQGDYVMDNNEIVPFDKATIYTRTFAFNTYKDVKLEGFNVESFIFNNVKMIEQETRFLKVK